MTNLPADLYNSLDRQLPVVLLPVRLEMRFGVRSATTSAGVEAPLPVLRLRIYPDDIAIDNHQQDLTEAEVKAGRAYWVALAAPADPAIAETQKLRAWETLTRLVGAHRATYVAELTRNQAEPPRRTTATAATAELLPDQWAVTGWVAGQRVFDVLSNPIRRPLAVGPTPRSDGQTIIDPASNLPLDEGSRWLADYEEAVAAGMAVTIDLVTPDGFAAGERPLAMTNAIEQLLVFGIREPLTAGIEAENKAALFGQLIHRHRTVHGAGFLPQGAPTNNLGNRRTPWRSRPDPYAVAPTTAAGTPSPGPEQVLRGFGNNAQTTEAALGLAAGLLSSLENAGLTEQLYARWMNEALFPVTWGELISTLLVPALIDTTTDAAVITTLEQAHAFARRQMLDYVRARGPLPVLRVGNQPYGILPITDFSAWAPQSDEDAETGALLLLLNRLRPFWESAAGYTVALERQLPDTDAATRRLIEIMGQGPVPHPASYGVRTVTGELASLRYMSSNPNLPRFDDLQNDVTVGKLVAQTEQAIYRRLLGTIPSLPKRSRFYGLQMQDPDLLVIPVAQTKEGFGPKEYLTRLGNADSAALQQALPGGGEAPPDLLYQLTHRSLRLATEQSIFALIRKDAGWNNFYLDLINRPLELYEVTTGNQLALKATFATPLGQLGDRLSLETVATDFQPHSLMEIATNRDLLAQFTRSEVPTPAFPQNGLPTTFLDTQEAVQHLAAAALSDADYERLVGETLALCATRFDAWQTSIATQRLDLLRRQRPTGLQIGAYGWLLNLPPYAEPVLSQETLVDRNAADGPLVQPARQVGFIHAPSLAQAETASVLRAAELSHGGESGSAVARLDLTAARMRSARWVLEAVHNGQPLGAVLGYRLERAFHDNGLSDMVDDIRAAFPQRSAPHPRDPDGANVQVVPHEVVDGEQARSVWKKGGINALGSWVQALGARADALNRVMQRVDAIAEAVADLLVAEGVHQIVSGNSSKAAATLNAVASGDPPPADFDVLRSPRNGVVLTHRVLLALQDSTPVQGWAATSARARLSPRLEAWAERLLGDPAHWLADVVVGPDDAPPQFVPINLAAVPGLSALDVIHEATTLSGSQSVLAERLVAAANQPGARVAQIAPLAAGTRGWDQLVALAGALQDLLVAGRPLTGQELLPPDAERQNEPVSTAEITQAQATLTTLITELKGATAELKSALLAAPPDVAGARSALPKLVPFGIVGSAQPQALDDARFLERAGAAVAASERTLLAVEGALAGRDGTPDAAPSFGKLLATARTLCGPATLLTPLLAAVPGLQEQPVTVNGSAPALDEWLTRLGRVRTALAGFEDVRLFCTTLGLPSLPLRVTQLPLLPEDGWLGGLLPPKESKNPLRRRHLPKQATTHLVMAAHEGFDPTGALAGLIIDEFSEVIPLEHQTTGVGLHYDAPNARPAQSLLLAVHPNPPSAELPWSWNMIETMLKETLALAKLRVVELEQLAPTAVDEYLPAIYARDGMANMRPLHHLSNEYFAQFGVGLATKMANLDWSNHE